MPQVQGGGTVMVGGPGSAEGLPIWGKKRPTSGSVWTFVQLNDLNGFTLGPVDAGVTAKASGTQTNGILLTGQVNSLTTVATAGDSVLLPVSTAGMQVAVINLGAAACQVYGSGTDTINGIATATGIVQLANSVATYICSAAGVWYTDTAGTGFSGNFPTVSCTAAITAHAGGTQAAAVPLVSVINEVTTCATNGDSVALPASAAGMEIFVANNTGHTLDVYPVNGGTDQINALAANAAYAMTTDKNATFYCAKAGQWYAVSGT